MQNVTTQNTQAENLYHHLKNHILSGHYRPSQRLVEQELVGQFGVSRHTVRIALERLHREGLIELKRNRGASVKALTLDDAIDMLYTRQVLEIAAARLATQRISPRQLEQLEEIITSMRECLDEGQLDAYSKYNRHFHTLILQSSGSRTLIEFSETVKTRLSRLQTRSILLPTRRERSFPEHKAIYDALVSRDSDNVEIAVRNHLESLRLAIIRTWNMVGM